MQHRRQEFSTDSSSNDFNSVLDISYNYAPACAFFDDDDVPEEEASFEDEVCLDAFNVQIIYLMRKF